ncbi:MAG TPA: hypothetical protein DIT25_00510 [Candidatus Moranbacteria bacterium]|nr:hypothetical protein [Candidatus Moranbacteria bacterium]
MDFESKQLKSSVEIAAEKTGLKNPENSGKLRTAADMAMEKVKLMQMDADVQQGDAEKIAELANKSGLDLSHSIAEKQEKAAEIKQEMAQFKSDTVAKETVEEVPVSENQGTQMDQEDMAKKYGFRTKEENERAVEQTNKELKSYSEAQENENGKKETTEESDIQKIISTQNRLNDLRANVYRERMSKQDPSWHGTVKERAEIDKLATEVESLIDEKAIVDKAKSEISERNFDLGRVTNEDLLLFHQRIDKSGDEIETDLLKDADIADSVIEDSRLRLSKLREDARASLKEAGDDPNLKNTIDEFDRQIGQLVRVYWKMKEKPKNTTEENSREVETTPESTEKDSKGELKTREQIQAEALTDFKNELKGIKKNEQWQGDSIMQGMEDFVNSQKEKTPASETFKDMFSFIKNKGAEINKGIISTKDAINDFSKKSSEWAKEIFKGKENTEKREKEISDPLIQEARKKRNQLLESRGLLKMSEDDFKKYFVAREFDIRDELKQANVGDCYAVAAIHALSRSPQFEMICRSSMKKLPNGSWEVRIPLLSEDSQTITITPEELRPQKNKQFLKRGKDGGMPDLRMKLRSMNGKEGLQVLEAAFIKSKFGSVDRLAAEGGWGEDVLRRLGGDNFKESSFDAPLKYNEKKKEWTNRDVALDSLSGEDMEKLDDYLENFDPEIHIATANTKFMDTSTLKGFIAENLQFYKGEGTMKLFVPGHAYSISKVDSENKIISVVNPWNTNNSIKLTFEQFKKIFDSVSGIRIDHAKMLSNMRNVTEKAA